MTCISPGSVDTQFHHGKNFGDETKLEPPGAHLKVEDVVRTVLWVLSSPDHVEVNDVVVRRIPQLDL